MWTRRGELCDVMRDFLSFWALDLLPLVWIYLVCKLKIKLLIHLRAPLQIDGGLMCSLCVRARDRALEHGAGQNIIHLMNINVDSTRFLYLSCLFLIFEGVLSNQSLKSHFQPSRAYLLNLSRVDDDDAYTHGECWAKIACEMPARVYRRYFYFF